MAKDTFKFLWWVHVIDKTSSEIVYESKFVGGNKDAVLMRIGADSGLSEDQLEDCHIMMHCFGEFQTKRPRKALTSGDDSND